MSVKVEKNSKLFQEKRNKELFFLVFLILTVYPAIKLFYSDELLLGIFTFLISFLTVVFLKDLNLEFLNDKISKGHAVHTTSVPRFGGLGIFLSVFLISIFSSGSDKTVVSFLIAGTIVFFIGFFEDIIQNIPPVIRLTIMSIPVLYIVLILNGIVFDIHYFKLFFPLAFVITVVGVIGVINAINIIDGLNGLASGISLITFLAFFFALGYQNESLSFLSIVLFAGTLGFFLVNIFTGKIFLGDGGSYFLGFALSEISVLMSNSTDLSPWFPVALLMYPIWEVLFSIFRRKLKGRGAMHPDKLHMHTLLYLRVFKKLFKNPVKANSLTSLFILFILAVLDTVVFKYRNNVDFLVLYIVLFAVFYVLFYRAIINFKIGKIFAPKTKNRKEKQVLEPVGEIKP